jgi:hypothetical protein
MIIEEIWTKLVLILHVKKKTLRPFSKMAASRKKRGENKLRKKEKREQAQEKREQEYRGTGHSTSFSFKSPLK